MEIHPKISLNSILVKQGFEQATHEWYSVHTIMYGAKGEMTTAKKWGQNMMGK